MKIKISVLFGVILISFLSCKTENSISDQSLNNLLSLLEKSVQIEKNRSYDLGRYLVTTSQSREKHKYMPVINAAMQVITKYENYYDEKKSILDTLYKKVYNLSVSEKESIFNQLKSKVAEIDSTMFIYYDSILMENYKIVGLRKEEMERRLKNIRKDLKKLEDTLITEFDEDAQSDLIFKIKLNAIEYTAFQKRFFFVNQYNDLFNGGQLCGWDRYIPFISAKENFIQSGDYFEAEVGIRLAVKPLDIEEAKVIFGKDTIILNSKTSVANYKFKPTHIGQKDYNVKCEFKNILTGEKLRSNMIYTVNVE